RPRHPRPRHGRGAARQRAIDCSTRGESVSAPPESFIRKTVRPLAAYGPPRDPAPVPLHLNESPNDVPEDLKRALVEKLFRSDWSKYPITDGARLARTLAE